MPNETFARCLNMCKILQVFFPMSASGMNMTPPLDPVSGNIESIEVGQTKQRI